MTKKILHRPLEKSGRKPYSDFEKELARKNRKEYEKNWHAMNPWSSKNICSRLLWNAKRRAKLNNLDFNITIDDIEVPELCPYLGIKLISSSPRGASREAVASLDRIDPSKGYVKGNIEVISHLANTMKNNATEQQLVTFARSVLQRRGLRDHHPQQGSSV